MAGLGLVYLLQYVPLEWLAKLPPGTSDAEDRDGVDFADVWPVIGDDGAGDGHVHDGGGPGGDAAGGHGGNGAD